MDPTVGVEITETVGGPVCVATDDGNLVFEKIAKALDENSKVILSFTDVDTITSAFLNAAVGQLFGRFAAEKIAASLEFSDADEEDRFLLKRVIARAKAYFADPERFEKLRSELADEDDRGDD